MAEETTDTEKNLEQTADQSANPAEQDSSETEEKYEIRVNSYELANALGVTAVHNEIAIYKNGEPLVAFNGNAHNNQTGELNAFAIQPGNTLRVSTGEPYSKSLKLVGSVTLDQFDRIELLKKLNSITAASFFINNNKMDYVVVGGPNFEAQNSNSVASALLHSMGYEYPDELKKFWAPGSKRNLLPDNWNTNTFASDNPDDVSELLASIEYLNRETVNASIVSENHPPLKIDAENPYFPDLFDPNGPNVIHDNKPKQVASSNKNIEAETVVEQEEVDDTKNEADLKSDGAPATTPISIAESPILTECKLTTDFTCASGDKPDLNPVSKVKPDAQVSATRTAQNNSQLATPTSVKR